MAKILFLVSVVINFSVCSPQQPVQQTQRFDINSIKTFRDIPGITDFEIEAIEGLKSTRSEFIYGFMTSTEAFALPDGTTAGFAVLLTDLLSELFDISFTMQSKDWTELKNGIDDKTIDFTGDMTPTPERMQVYYMSLPVAERGLSVFTRHDLAQIKLEDFKDLKTGFYKGTITAESILSVYSDLDFQIVDVYGDRDVKENLSSGVIDVFICDATEALVYSDTFKSHKNIFPLIYTPVSLTTGNSEFAPVISVMSKYIAAGGIDKLYDFYKEGYLEFAKHDFQKSLTDTEKAYIDNLSITNRKVPIAFESDNYPVCFYNENDGEFQGIAVDVLGEISLLTGIEFENVSAKNEAWVSVLEKLTSGEVKLVTELLYTEERKDRFLWPDIPYAVSRYALISKSDYPYLEPYQVVRASVGAMTMSGREDTYRFLFPNLNNLVRYDYQGQAFDALERGEVDLVMSTEYDFLTLINYLEKPGYKINIVFNSPLVESFYGFNINEETLKSIVSKSLRNIDTSRIERDWVTRTFNYERMMADQRSYYANQVSLGLAIFIGILLLLLTSLSVLLRKNIKTRKLYKNEVEEKKLMEIAITSANERLMLMLDTSPLCAQIWERNLNTIDCNEAAVRMYGFKNKQEYRDRFITSCSPEYQPDGQRSDEKAVRLVHQAFEEGFCKFDWMHKMPDDNAENPTLIPAEVTLVRGKYGKDDVVIGYTRDLREYNKMMDTIKYREKLLRVLNNTAIEFTAQQNKSFEDIMTTGLKLIIDELDLDRLSVWRNFEMEDGLHTSQIYRWDKISGGTTEPTAELKDVLLANLAPSWERILTKGDAINSPVRLLPEAAVFQSFGVISAFVTAIFIDNAFWGFVLFEDRRNERYFDENSADIMRSVAFMCANTVLRNQLIIKNQQDTVMLENALNRMYEAMEFAEQSNRAKTIFLAQMSHEIRTPMNAILGISEIFLQNKNSLPGGFAGADNTAFVSSKADAEEGFRKIFESGSLLLNIINDILDFSKIEAGKLEIIPKKYDIPSFVNNTVQINRIRYEDKPIEFTLHLDENTPLVLEGDELRIRQVLNNLLSNAYKYTETGKVGLSITFEPGLDNENVTIIYKVTDTGQGMNPDQLDRLFTEYERFNMETNHGISGTGLGMSITKRIIELMNGEILVESEVGKGSVFTVRIPQKKCGFVVCGKEVAESLQNFSFHNTTITKNEQIERRYMSHNKVLIVDDVESNLYVAKGLMLPYGLFIETVNSGFEAIEKIKGGSTYDIVFMDHMMPKMNGMEATKIMRSMGYTHPVVALTANVISGQEQKFLSNGFDGFLAKPIDSRELDLLLTRFIRDKKHTPVDEEKAQQKKDKNEITDKMKKFFVIDAENAIDVLKKLETKLHNLNDEEIESYVVTIHGIKSSLAIINEKILSDAAYKLEQAGQQRDIAVMADDTPAFIEWLQSAVDKYKSAETAGDADITSENMVFLQEKLQKIHSESESFNIKAAKAALADLNKKEWPRGINNIIEEISVGLLHGDFKKVMSVAEKAMEKKG